MGGASTMASGTFGMDGGRDSGSRAVNRVPLSRVDVTVIRPSWACTIWEQMCNPNPRP